MKVIIEPIHMAVEPTDLREFRYSASVYDGRKVTRITACPSNDYTCIADVYAECARAVMKKHRENYYSSREE